VTTTDPTAAPYPATDPYRATVVSLRAAGCVFAEEEARLLLAAASHPAELTALIARRTAGLPLEQVLGWADFAGLRIAVEPGVFVPRPRTEFLVRAAARRWAAGQGADCDRSTPVQRGAERPVLLDLCCGSGALAAAFAAAVPVAALYASDIDPVAVRCARRNLAHLPAMVCCGDLFDPLPDTLRGRVDVLLANVPYVPTGELDLLPPEAREHEPTPALDGGPDGLDLVRRVAAAAPAWLAPGGVVLVESSAGQAEVARSVFAGHGLTAEVATDPPTEATVVIAVRPAGWRGVAAGTRMGR
jgi:release factor glutamine methyltransferase